MTILSMAKAIAVIAQGVRRNFFLNIVLRNEDILLPKIEQAFEGIRQKKHFVSLTWC